MESPFLRIVLIVRDSTSTEFRTTMDSLTAQTYENYAVEVVDLNELGGAASLGLQEDMAMYPGADYRQTPGVESLGAARSGALNALPCDYIAFACPGEIWDSRKAAMQIYQLEAEPRSAVSCCDGEMIYRRARHTETVRCLASDSYRAADWLLERPVKTGGQAMYRTEALKAIGGFDSMMDVQCDLDVMLRLPGEGRVLFLPLNLITCDTRVSRYTYLDMHSDYKRLLGADSCTDILLADRPAFLAFDLERARLARLAGLPLDCAALIALAMLRSPLRFIAEMTRRAARGIVSAVKNIARRVKYRAALTDLLKGLKKSGEIPAKYGAPAIENYAPSLSYAPSTEGSTRNVTLNGAPTAEGGARNASFSGESTAEVDARNASLRGMYATGDGSRNASLDEASTNEGGARNASLGGAPASAVYIRVLDTGNDEISPFSYIGDDSLARVVIPRGVTRIGRGAFARCENLVSITIPDTLAGIGDGAFLGCVRLTEVRFGEKGGLRDIGAYAFAGCSGLSGLRLPGGLRTIGKGCFALCVNMENLEFFGGQKFPGFGHETAFATGVQAVPADAFACCRKLAGLRFGAGSLLRSIGDRAFSGCEALNEVWLDAQVETIGARAFSGCVKLRNLVLINNVSMRHIGPMAFMDCEKLLQFVFPSGITRIERGAFLRCRALSGVRLPKGVEVVCGRAFEGCEAIGEVAVDNPYAHMRRRAFDKGVILRRGSRAE